MIKFLSPWIKTDVNRRYINLSPSDTNSFFINKFEI